MRTAPQRQPPPRFVSLIIGEYGRAMRGRHLIVVLAFAGCGRIAFDLSADAATSDGFVAPIDAPFVWGPPFQPPQLLPEASSAGDEYYPDLAADGLSIYISSDGFPSPLGSADIYVLTRSDTTQPFGAPVNTAISSVNWDMGPSISDDGLSLYFSPQLNDGFGRDIWIATRPDLASPFSNPQKIAALSAAGEDRDPDISADGLTLYYDSDRAGSMGSTDIWMSTRPDLGAPFGPPCALRS